MTTGTLAPPRTQYRHSQHARTGPIQKILTRTPLLVILVAQAYLSLRFVHSIGIDYGDETIYLYSGHQLIYELFHGGGSPYYETWFSGAPVLYPVLAAMLDHVGGIILVREFSLACMLGATTLLYLTTWRIFGRWTGLTAAGLFAALGITQRLGVLATFDPPSLLVMAAAAYAAVRGAVSTRWLVMVPILLFAANALKYASVVFDPVVIVLAALQLRDRGLPRIAQRVAALAAASGILTAVAVLLAGSAYWQGILFTTLERKAGAQIIFGLTNSESARGVIDASWSWIGIVVVIGALALIVTLLLRGERANFWLLALLVVAGLVVTVEGIRLHTDQSMIKHDDFGIWFTCIAAGYALARAAEVLRRPAGRFPVIIFAFSVVAWTTMHYFAEPGKVITAGMTNATRPKSLAAATQGEKFLAPWIRGDLTGRYLIGGLDSYQTLYSDHLAVYWWQWSDDIYIKYPVPGGGGDWHGQMRGLACGGFGQPPAATPGCIYLEGIPGYQAAIHTHAFAIVSLYGNHGMNSQDRAILAAVESTPGYVQVSDQGGAPTFIYAPDYPDWERDHLAAASEYSHATRHPNKALG